MIEAIFICAETGGEQAQADEVELVAGKGIVGDRNFNKEQWPGQNVTFVEAEEVERFNETHGEVFSLSAFRRNLITRDIRLNELVGQSFTIGGVEFYGVELCEPCASLAVYLANDTLAAATVVKDLTYRAGLRANVLSDGRVSVGMSLVRVE